MNDIEAVIVTWNSAATIERCLASCAGLAVTVVDNASIDDTVSRVRRHPHVYLIENAVNRGFAAAVNQAVAASGSDFVLLLNPDAELLGSVEPLLEACSENGVAMSAGRLVGLAGATQTGFTVRRLPAPMTLAFEAAGINRLWPSNPVNRRYRCLDADLNAEADVEQPAGAFLFFPRRLWRDLGGFDESFSPVWFEDVDFCKRALERGRIRFVPLVSARHQGAASIARLDWSSRQLFWYGSLLRYASKHFRPSQFRGVCGAVVLGSVIRSISSIFHRRRLRDIQVYAGIAGQAVRCMLSGRMRNEDSVEGYRQGSEVRTITNVSE